jgi:hypothetical protein
MLLTHRSPSHSSERWLLSNMYSWFASFTVVVERRVLSSLDEGMYNTTYVLRGVLSLCVRRSLLACQFFIVLLSDFSCGREIFVRNRGMMQKQRTGATVNVQCLDASEGILPVIRGSNVQWHACRLLKAEVLVPFGLRILSILFSCWCFLHRFSVLSRHTIKAQEKEITFQISVGLFSGEVLKSVVTGQAGLNFTCGCRSRRQVIWVWFSSYSFWMMLLFFLGGGAF